MTGDAASELRATLAELRSNSEAICGIFDARDCGKLRKLLPPELRNLLNDEKNHEDIFELATFLLGSTLGEESQ